LDIPLGDLKKAFAMGAQQVQQLLVSIVPECPAQLLLNALSELQQLFFVHFILPALQMARTSRWVLSHAITILVSMRAI
jgi:hypothetical protein